MYLFEFVAPTGHLFVVVLQKNMFFAFQFVFVFLQVCLLLYEYNWFILNILDDTNDKFEMAAMQNERCSSVMNHRAIQNNCIARIEGGARCQPKYHYVTKNI